MEIDQSSRARLNPRGETHARPRIRAAILIRVAVSLALIALLANQSARSTLSTQNSTETTPYDVLGLEATNWITSFQVTPLNDTWGIPYWNYHAWGLDPYFFANGTITGGLGGITAGERQRLAYLIGGHDAGEGAYASLIAYLDTKDPRYLAIFHVYYDYFLSAQLPGTRTSTPAVSFHNLAGKNTTIDDSGFWAEQATVSANNGPYGNGKDTADLEAAYPAAEHGNPIAIALIAYYRITHDPSALMMLNRYGNWLVRCQIKSGEYSGAFPVTQYYFTLGWKPRMYETTESAWVLSELYLLTNNQTYLDAAQAAGQYMLSRQFIGPEWVGTPVYGALPYEWNETHYTRSVSTNHAGLTILAWVQLFRITGNTQYLIAAKTYANWLLSFQVTRPDMGWGNHTFANDSMAVGGFYYGYSTQKREFGWRVAEALWSAAYALPALIALYQVTSYRPYYDSALLAADWLTRMRYPNESLIPLQALAVVKYPLSSWWGPYPQYYQPDMREVTKAGIDSFVEQGTKNESSIKNAHPSWFEKTFSVDFNLIDYQMASLGPTYMKMLWSWWPSVGFEPRYGGDIAFGAFAADGFLTYNATLQRATATLDEIDTLTGNDTSSLPPNVAAAYQTARALAFSAAQNFNFSWFAIARTQAADAVAQAENALTYAQALSPLRQANQLILGLLVVIATTLLLTNLYWHRRLTHSARGRKHHRRQRK